MGPPWFLSYALVLVFIHHAFLFFLEAANPSLFWPALFKTMASTTFTTLVIVIVQYFQKK
ncbi:MAG: hypothetical protein H7Z75_08225 [Ferruginibacter sp.]|nr:hypothetical protein [Cytophagales bacterium]